jgi:hypothetical protein
MNEPRYPDTCQVQDHHGRGEDAHVHGVRGRRVMNLTHDAPEGRQLLRDLGAMPQRLPLQMDSDRVRRE